MTPVGEAGWPESFIPLDGALAEPGTVLTDLRSGQITLLGSTVRIGDPVDWQQRAQPRLWRFHLYYWDWAWALAASSDRETARAEFARLWRSWQEGCPLGRADAWLPYPAALRAWSWCGLYRPLVAGTRLDGPFRHALRMHAAFLRRHLEYDVGGNHLIKDLKALLGLGVFNGDEAGVRSAVTALERQIRTQVLADGGHYERAPAYHCQVLGDLIDIATLLAQSGRRASPVLDGAIAAMREWLGAVLGPDGGVPLLNDGFEVAPARLALLSPAQAPSGRVALLGDTGLVRAADGPWHLLADVGDPCPDELPAHAHADTLGFLLYLNGAPLLADTGTSTYAAGPIRDYERSTAAHSTVQVADENSTEVWGAFRAGRRARVRRVVAREDSGSVLIEASHDGYRHLPSGPVHTRRWTVEGGQVLIHDRVDSATWRAGVLSVTARWQFAPGWHVALDDDGATVTGPGGSVRTGVKASVPFRLRVRSRPVATGFGRTTLAPALCCEIEARLPVRCVTTWRRVRFPVDLETVGFGPAAGGEA